MPITDDHRPPISLFCPSYRIEECLDGIRACLASGWTGLGGTTLTFEADWKDYTALPHAHFTNSSTAGLHLALEVFKRRLGWREQDEVITTPLTFVATNHAILHTRLTPVFADVDDQGCLDPGAVEARLTAKTRAVMFVGLGGRIGQLPAIAELCKHYGLTLILDAAHMAGTRHQGRHVGSEADAAIFSFHAVKNLPTADSGMACFRLAEDDAMARRLSWMGIDQDTYSRTLREGSYRWRYHVPEVGYKYHGNSIMAAIGRVQLRYLDADNACRRQFATRYRQRLETHPQIVLLPQDPQVESATHLFQVRLANRDATMAKLNEVGIFPGVHYRDNTEYPMYRQAVGTCPQAARLSQELMSLPLHLKLTDQDVDYLCDQLLDLLG